MEASLGITDAQVTHALSVGYVVYALGKLLYGRVVDVVGGRVACIASFTGGAIATAAFALCPPGVGAFTAVWVASRACQPAAGLGSVRLATCWWPHTELGTVLAVLAAANYVFDAGVRLWISGMTWYGVEWRGIAVVMAVTAFVVAALGALVLRDRRGMTVSPHAVDPARRPEIPLAHGLALLLRSVDFWLLLLCGLTLGTLREIFLCFLEPLLRHAGASASMAIALSGAFPLFGVPGVIVCGKLVDRFDRRRNGAIMFASSTCLLALSAALWFVESRSSESPSPTWAVATLSALIGGFVIGPYSLVGGVFAADLGGQAMCALTSGLVFCAAYTGAIVFTACKSELADDSEVLLCVLATSAANFVASALMLCRDGHRTRSLAQLTATGDQEPLLINAG